MQTLNVKAAVISFIVLIVVTGSTHLLHSYQLKRQSATYHELALAAWNDKPRRDADALICMTEYLRQNPKDWAANTEMGFWLGETGRFSAASAKLEEVLRAVPKQGVLDPATITEIHRKLVQLAMALNRFSDAQYHLSYLLKDYPDDSKIDNEGASMLKMLGKCQIALGNDAKAKETFQRALKNPKNRGRVDIWYELAMTLQFKLQDEPAARKVMAEMIAVKQNDESAHAHHVYGVWLAEVGQYEEALRQAEATLKLEKDHPGGLYLAGDCELHRRHFPMAEKYAIRGMEVAPQDVAMYVLLANVYFRSNGREKAIAVLNKGVEALSTRSAKCRLLWHLANLYLDGQGAHNSASIAKAEEYIQQLRDFSFSPTQLDFLDARVLYANDDWHRARDAFDKVRPLMNDFPQLMKCLDFWIGYCYLQQGNPDRAMAAFRSSLAFDKFYFKARDGIAMIFQSNGMLKDAAEEYRQVLAGNDQDGDAWLAYVRTLMLQNLRSKDEERNWDFVLQQLERAKQIIPHEGQLDLFRAEIALAQGKPNEAERILTSLRTVSPKSVEFCVGQANLCAKEGQPTKAAKILADGRERLGDHFLLRLAEAALALREEGFAQGRKSKRRHRISTPSPPRNRPSFSTG